MIKLSLEIPTPLLADLTSRTDMDFVLAHRVLEDEEYRRFYASRGQGRELLLDNSMHELGEPLPIKDLKDAAIRVHADYVVTPDRLGDPEWTLAQFFAAKKELAPAFKIAVAMSGRTPEERQEYLREVYDAQMLCLPYRENRLEWWEEQKPRWWSRIHLFGVSTLNELREWVKIEDGSLRRFSVDTAKPLKAAFIGRKLDDGDSLRHMPISSKDLLGMSATGEQLELIHDNVRFLRKVIRSEA